jgi:two-component system, OmpR family, sensor histidine kinase MprB
VATIAVGAANYRSTRDRLLAEIDRSLVAVDARVSERIVGREDGLPERGPFAGFDAQIVRLDGSVGQSTFDPPLPVGETERSLAGDRGGNAFSTVAVDGESYRVRTVGFERGALQIARSLDETERVLQALRARILLWTFVVVAAAVAVGWWIASSVTASLRRLTTAAEHVEATGRLDVSVGQAGDDEVGRLGAAFDRMLAALQRSRDDQERLVQDAGHELRTPLTSLRTNLDALERYPSMSQEDRDAILADLRAETYELTELVDEIVTVASGAHSDEPFETVDLLAVAHEVAARFERRTGHRITVVGVPELVPGQRASLHRALSCLLDNACKFDRGVEPVEVVVEHRTVTVVDHGPGIPAADLALVFDRFHRAESARALPGSGLGLSIVRDVARRHGGDAFAGPGPSGGARVGFTVAAMPPPDALPISHRALNSAGDPSHPERSS